jgi:hypothetical protein
MKRLLGTIGGILLALSCVVLVHAQSATIDLGLSTLPLNPLPLQKVTLTVQSYSTDLSQATISWTYNNQAIASGIGRTDISIIAPASGVAGNVTVTASGAGFATTSATLLLRPASVDVLWEGVNSSTPPFYKGLALPSLGGIVRMTAIPSISAPRQMSFNWSHNGDAQPSRSGYNKSSFVFQNSDLVPTDHIEVVAQSGSFSGTSSADIAPGDPTIRGYINTDGYIDYANGSDNRLDTNAAGVIAHFEPYFFSTPTSISHDLKVSYSDPNGVSLPAGDIPNELRLSRPDNGGRSQFSVAIQTVVYSIQNIVRQFSINFN